MILQYSQLDHYGIYDNHSRRFSRQIQYQSYNENLSLMSAFQQFPSLHGYKIILFELKFFPLDFIDVIKYLKELHNARIVVFCTERLDVNTYIAQLIKNDVHDIKTFKPNAAIQEYVQAFQDIVMGQGVDYSEVLYHKNAVKYENIRNESIANITLNRGQSLDIAVAGTLNRIGTTTQSFMMYFAAALLGLKPIIIKPSEDINYLINLFPHNHRVQGGTITINGIDFALSKQVGAGYNCNIYDLGIFNKDVFRVMEYCKLSFLIAGSKPWELQSLASIVEGKLNLRNLNIILSFTDDEGKGKVEKLIGKETILSPYCPNIFKLNERIFYTKLLSKLSKEAS